MGLTGLTKNSRFWALVFFCYLAVLLIIFALAYMRMIPTKLAYIPFYDTIGHFILLGLAAFLAHRALDRKGFHLLGLPIPWGPFLLAVFAVLEEFLQRFSAYRTFDPFDLAANLSGILFFWYLDTLLHSIERLGDQSFGDTSPGRD